MSSLFQLQPDTCHETLPGWDWRKWRGIESAWKLSRLRSQHFQSAKGSLSQDFENSSDKNDHQQWWQKECEQATTFSFGDKGREQIWQDVVQRFGDSREFGVFAFQPVNCSCHAHPWRQGEDSLTGGILTDSGGNTSINVPSSVHTFISRKLNHFPCPLIWTPWQVTGISGVLGRKLTHKNA